VARWPRARITLRQGARVVHDTSHRLALKGLYEAVCTTCQLLARPVPGSLWLANIGFFVGDGLSLGPNECAFSSDQAGARKWHGKN
jgi:hypothetical protein